MGKQTKVIQWTRKTCSHFFTREPSILCNAKDFRRNRKKIVFVFCVWFLYAVFTQKKQVCCSYDSCGHVFSKHHRLCVRPGPCTVTELPSGHCLTWHSHGHCHSTLEFLQSDYFVRLAFLGKKYCLFYPISMNLRCNNALMWIQISDTITYCWLIKYEQF